MKHLNPVKIQEHKHKRTGKELDDKKKKVKEGMIKLKNLVNESNAWDRKFGEPLPTLRLEQDEPEHFGGGENIDILGFKTEHFDICRSAVILYNKLKEKELNDIAKELVVDSAKDLDHIFEMEKQVVGGKKVDHDPVEHAVELIIVISIKIGRVAEIINDDFERDTNFIKLHVMEIVKRSK